MDSIVITEDDVHWIVKLMFDNGDLVQQRDRLCMALGLTISCLADIKRTITIDMSGTHGFFTMALNEWILMNCNEVTFGKLIQVLQEEGFNSTADELCNMNPDEIVSIKSNMYSGATFWFDVPEKIFAFTGRQVEMEELHSSIMKQGDVRLDKEITVLTAVRGTGGVGKTTLTIHYAWEYFKKFYVNVIWINSETKEILSDSFNRLGRKLKKDPSLEFKYLVSEIYECFSKNKTLIIFDNVETFDDIKQFLPIRTPNTLKPFVLLTSRNHEWNLKTNQIDLNVFSIEDSIQFFKAFLNLNTEGEVEYARKISIELQNLPLAVRQAAAYIKVDNEKNNTSEIVESMKRYLELFKTNSIKLLNFEHWKYTADIYEKSVYSTWVVTMDRLKIQNSFTETIIRLAAYFNSDNIPIKLFYSIPRKGLWNRIRGNRVNQILVDEAIEQLVNFSLVTKQKETDSISVHRLLQKVVRDDIEMKCGNSFLMDAINLVQMPLEIVLEEGYNDYRQACLIHSLSVAKLIRSNGLTGYMYKSFLKLVDLTQEKLAMVHSDRIKKLLLECNYDEILKSYLECRQKYLLVTRTEGGGYSAADQVFRNLLASHMYEEIRTAWKTGKTNNAYVQKLCQMYKVVLCELNPLKDNLFDAKLLYNIAYETNDTVIKMNLFYIVFQHCERELKNLPDLAKNLVLYEIMFKFENKNVANFLELFNLHRRVIIQILSGNSTALTGFEEYILSPFDLLFDLLMKCKFPNMKENILQGMLDNYKELYNFFKLEKRNLYTLRCGLVIIHCLTELNHEIDIVEFIFDLKIVLNKFIVSDNHERYFKATQVPETILKIQQQFTTSKNELIEAALHMYELICISHVGVSDYKQFLDSIVGKLNCFIKLSLTDQIINTIRDFKDWLVSALKKNNIVYLCDVKSVPNAIFQFAKKQNCTKVRDLLLEESVVILEILYKQANSDSELSDLSEICTTLIIHLAEMEKLNKILELLSEYKQFLTDMVQSGINFSDNLNCLVPETVLKIKSEMNLNNNIGIALIEKAYSIYLLTYKYPVAIRRHFDSSEYITPIRCLAELDRANEIIDFIKNFELNLQPRMKNHNTKRDYDKYIQVEIANSTKEIAKHHHCINVKNQLIRHAVDQYNNKLQYDYMNGYIDCPESFHGVINALMELNDNDELIKIINQIPVHSEMDMENVQRLINIANYILTVDGNTKANISIEILQKVLLLFKASYQITVARTSFWNYNYNYLIIKDSSQGIILCLKKLNRTAEIVDSIQDIQNLIHEYCDSQVKLPEKYLVFTEVFNDLYDIGIQSTSLKIKQELLNEALLLSQIKYNFEKKINAFDQTFQTLSVIVQVLRKLKKIEQILTLSSDFQNFIGTNFSECSNETIQNMTYLSQILLFFSLNSNFSMKHKNIVEEVLSISKKWFNVAKELNGLEDRFTLTIFHNLIICEFLLHSDNVKLLENSQQIFSIVQKYSNDNVYLLVLAKLSIELKYAGAGCLIKAAEYVQFLESSFSENLALDSDKERPSLTVYSNGEIQGRKFFDNVYKYLPLLLSSIDNCRSKGSIAEASSQDNIYIIEKIVLEAICL